MPLFHVHGLVGAVLSSLCAGASVVCTPGFHAADFCGWLEESQPSWFTAVPTMHQAVVARVATNGGVRHRLRFIRSCSSALAPKLMAEMEAAFGVPVIEAYGMTEASHQVASNPLPPRRRQPGSVGLAAGPEVAVMSRAGQLLQAGATGEIVIRGANVTHGYESNETTNREAFAAGWFRTGDEGRLDADGYVFLTGRIKEIINRGGEKISPREIDEVLLDHPAVAQAVAFAMPDPNLGEEVAAAVVLRENTTTTEQVLRRFAAMRLAHFKVPAKVVILRDIPKGPTGKLQRVNLAKTLGLASAAPSGHRRPDYVAPQTAVEQTLAGIWAEVLRVSQVGLVDNFFDLGGDSLAATRVAARLRQALGAEVPLVDLLAAPTLGAQAALVENALHVSTVEEVAGLLEEVESLTTEQTRELLERHSHGNTHSET
jgi:acyl-CoA synthetase (AMP-forming)/AMP-acid ligase II/acyl carrier protein